MFVQVSFKQSIKLPIRSQYAFVCNTMTQKPQQPLMVHIVEEALNVCIKSIMRISFWSKSVGETKKINIVHDLDAIYIVMDKVYENIGHIKQITFQRTKNLFPDGIDLLLFDVTTLYFESTTTDEIRAFGYSKDHRFNTTQ